jgi:hypothetical protein
MIDSLIKGLRSFYIVVIILFNMLLLSLCFYHDTIIAYVDLYKSQLERDNIKIELSHKNKNPFRLIDNMFDVMEGKGF